MTRKEHWSALVPSLFVWLALMPDLLRAQAAMACTGQITAELEKGVRQILRPIAAGTMHVLAWNSVEIQAEPRETSDGTLVLIEPAFDAQKREWVLLDLYRHPMGGWFKTEYGQPWYTGIWRFNHRPTNKDIYASTLYWFDGRNPWPIVAGEVCEAEWTKATKEKPSRRLRIRPRQ